ncbi:DUF6124 family protein [Pseudomonas sp. PB106]|uniref:DUF6124 family protein n=1 Tax=Pseudomonas sp. PB106 TaxID=2494699 RepID=UPI00131B320C|nr:DUF6124 family protein [Pseudomonas sp. PB106]KAE9643448.1 hypothetical protein EJA71_16380 [Pseudomonas sp. PB106]
MTDETFSTEATSPYESPNSKKFHEAAERALDHHFKPPIEPHPKRETGLFSLSPGTDAEALMANASEDLLSISVIACDLADDLHGSRRSVALALSRMADGVRLMVEGMLDQIEVRRTAAKP